MAEVLGTSTYGRGEGLRRRTEGKFGEKWVYEDNESLFWDAKTGVRFFKEMR